MKRLVCAGILSASVLAACVHWRIHQNLYSVNIYSGGRAYGPGWHVGSPPNWFGFSEYTDVGFPIEWGKKNPTPTYTDIDLGSHRLTIKAHAWVVALALASAVASLCWLAVVTWDSVMGKQSTSDAGKRGTR